MASLWKRLKSDHWVYCYTASNGRPCPARAEGIKLLNPFFYFLQRIYMGELHFPLAAVVAGQPLGVATLGEGVLLGIPRDGLLVVVGLVEQVTSDCRACANDLVGDRLLPGLH